MKSKTILFLILLFLAIFALSCGSLMRVIHIEVSCGSFEQNPTSMRNDLDIYIGDRIYLEFCSNPSTGYEWQYKISGDTAIKEVEHVYQAPNSDVPGAPGKQTWVFEGVDEGTAEISLGYSQPWDGGIKDTWTYKIRVVVSPAGIRTPEST